jgi:hypothetical protein
MTVDLRGGVDLSLPIHTIDYRSDEAASQVLAEDAERRLRTGQAPRWMPEEDRELTRLMVGAILEAYLRQTARRPFAAFGVDAHPETVTLAQLAAVLTPHHGLVGQSFEFAVAAAVQSQVPAVVEPLADALRLLGHPVSEPVGMLLLGLEKLSATDRDRACRIVRAKLPADGVVRTGGRGRPMSAATAIERLSGASWAELRRQEQAIAAERAATGSPGHATVQVRTVVSQLPRADALVFSGKAIVPASLKVNALTAYRHRRGWKDVPLWITRRPGTSGRPAATSRVRVHSGAVVPMVEVALGAPVFDNAGEFFHAVGLVDALLRDARLGRASGQLARLFSGREPASRTSAQAHLNGPLADLLVQLRRGSPAELTSAVAALIDTRDATRTISVLDDPAITTTYTHLASEGALFTLHEHLYVPTTYLRSTTSSSALIDLAAGANSSG